MHMSGCVTIQFLLPSFWPRRLCIRHPRWRCNAQLAIVITNFRYLFLSFSPFFSLPNFFFQLCQNIGGNKFSQTGVSPKWVKSKRRKRKKEDRKLVITMASYPLQRHLGWDTRSRLGQQQMTTLVVEFVEYKTHGQTNRLAFYVGCQSCRLPSKEQYFFN